MGILAISRRRNTRLPSVHCCYWLMLAYFASVQICLSQTDEVSCEPSCPALDLDHSANFEDEAIHSIRCTLACLEDFGVSLKRLTNFTVWPTLAFYDLENDCASYQKIQECRTGCVTAWKNPLLSPPKCRDECYSTCRDDVCNGEISCSQSETSCERKCRERYCRIGCQLYSGMTSPPVNAVGNTTSNPVAAPSLAMASSTQGSGEISIDLSAAIPQEPNSTSVHPPIVGFILRVSASKQRNSYYWLADLSKPLDLSTFQCSNVSISFAVVSKYNMSSYSTAAYACIPQGEIPSQVDRNTIQVTYSEDMRPGYNGYSVANITWEKPQGFEYITSYTIVLTPDLEFSPAQCGANYQISSISKEATHFVLKGKMRFGCSYTFTIRALPAPTNELGTLKTLAPELPSIRLPLMLACSKHWETNRTFSISVSFTLPNSSLLVDTIKQFSVSSMLRDSTYQIWNLRGIIEEFPVRTVLPQNNQIQYSINIMGFSPQINRNYIYRIKVMTEKKSDFFWRNIPGEKTCEVDASGLPPSPVSNVHIVNEDFRDTGNNQMQLNLHLQWNPPAFSNGIITQYEIRLGTEPLLPESQSRESDIFVTKSGNTTAHINVTLNEPIHCLHLQIRAFNVYHPSNWTESTILPYDSECDIESHARHSSPTNSSESHIAVYYESGNNTTKLAEISCSDIHESSIMTSKKLQDLENKLDGIAVNMITQNSAEELSTRLARIEQKLETIINLLSASSSP